MHLSWFIDSVTKFLAHLHQLPRDDFSLRLGSFLKLQLVLSSFEVFSMSMSSHEQKPSATHSSLVTRESDILTLFTATLSPTHKRTQCPKTFSKDTMSWTRGWHQYALVKFRYWPWVHAGVSPCCMPSRLVNTFNIKLCQLLSRGRWGYMTYNLYIMIECDLCCDMVCLQIEHEVVIAKAPTSLSVAEVICQQAEVLPVHLVIMSSSGKHGVSYYEGSILEQCVVNCVIPVLQWRSPDSGRL